MDNKEMREREKIRARYFRATAACPSGSVIHHGDCRFHGHKVCTCGLLHDLIHTGHELAQDIYPGFEDDLLAQHSVFDHRPGPPADFSDGRVLAMSLLSEMEPEALEELKRTLNSGI